MRQQVQADSKSQPGSKRATRNAIQLLTSGHEKVSKIFEQYEKMKGKGSDEERRELVMQACNTLTVHAQIEEEIFYPSVREIPGAEDLIAEAKVEHATIKKLVSELEFMNPDDELYDARFTVLAEYVTHHVKEEKSQIFPIIKKGNVDLNQLGDELEQRRQALATL